MSEIKDLEMKMRQYRAMSESYNLGTLYSKVLDHMSKNPSYNSAKFAEACKELDEIYFEDFVVPVLDTLNKTYDEMPDILKLNGATFYKNPEIDYKIIPTLFNVKPSAGKIDKDTTWKRGTEGLQEWKDTELAKEKKLEKKINLLFQSLDMLEKSEDYKQTQQELAVVSSVKTPTTVTQSVPETPEEEKERNAYDSVISHFNEGAEKIVAYKWLKENTPKQSSDEIQKICDKMIQLYNENFIEPCLGVYGCPATKQEMGEPVISANKYRDDLFEFNLHPVIQLYEMTENLDICIIHEGGYRYSVYLGDDEDEEMDVGDWARGRIEEYEKQFDRNVDYLKKNLVKLALIEA